MAHPNLDGLSLHEEEEEEGFCFDFDEEEAEQVDLRWCLVGRFLCERAIHFNSMKVRMADLWKPVKGVTIKEATGGKFLFHFAHPLDMEAVLNGGPWSFDNNMLILEQMQLGMQVEQIPLHYVNLWVQVHNLPLGTMKEKNGIQLANYIGSFVEYDKNNNTSFWRQYMRLRVKLDVRQPLKQNTKVKNKDGEWCNVNFKYEKLGIFCFVCGIMGHAENKCEVRFAMEHDDGTRRWSAEIRAEQRRQGGRFASRWLRDDKGGREENDGGGTTVPPVVPETTVNWGPTDADVAFNTQKAIENGSSSKHPTIITRQDHSLTINSVLARHNDTTFTSQNVTNKAINAHLTYPQPATKNSNGSVPSFILTDQSFNSLPFMTDQSQLNLNKPIIALEPRTENYNSQLLPNQNNPLPNQSIIADPPQSIKQLPWPNKKHETVPTLPNMTFRSNPKPILDPKLNRNRPDKKPKINKTKPTPTHTLPDPKISHGTQQENDGQTEKKRRREEDATVSTSSNEEIEHFLTAGPGSQACRDQ
jgi:hypothetical protein